MKKLLIAALALLASTVAQAQTSGNVPLNAFPIGLGPGKVGFKSIMCTAGNIRVDCKDASTTAGSMLFNQTGNSKDSTVTVVRIQ